MAILSALALCLLFLLSSSGVSKGWSGDGKPPSDSTKDSPDEGGTNRDDASPTTEAPGVATSPNTTASTNDFSMTATSSSEPPVTTLPPSDTDADTSPSSPDTTDTTDTTDATDTTAATTDTTADTTDTTDTTEPPTTVTTPPTTTTTEPTDTTSPPPTTTQPVTTATTTTETPPTTETDTPTTESPPTSGPPVTTTEPPTTPSTEPPTTPSTEPPTTPSTEEPQVVEPTYPPGGTERSVSLSIFFILMLLGVSTILVHLMIKYKLHFLPESIAFLLIGFFVGLILFIVKKINPEVELQYQERFDPNPFFLLLLPPIIFESGYSLHKGNFFKNIGSIVIFAVLGTAISAIIVGGGLFLLSAIGVVYELNFIQSFTFGALISAVDPVATLAIFHALEVNPTLNMLVFGESVLNDAVSIVMTKTIMEQASSSIDSPGLIVAHAFWKFLVMFCGSALLGIVSALASALFLKYVNLREISSLEFVMWFIFGFGPYFIAEGLNLSGIMAVLFSGIVMSHYTHFNLSPVTQVTVQQTMRTVSFMAETVVFLYIGMQVFTITTSFSIGLIIWSLILILIGRAANIFPLSYLVNRFRHVQISPRMQFVMWFSGLRGAIAYALALNLQENVDTFASAETIRVLDTATLIIVLFTIVGLGASTLPLLKFLSKGSAANEVTLSKTEDQGAAITYPEELEEQLSIQPPASSRHQWFLYLDYKYFRPFLIRRFTKQEVLQARVDMQRRTNEWYQGLREVSSEEDEEDVILELETTFSSPQLKKTKNPPPGAMWGGGGGGGSDKSPPPRGGGGGGGRGLLNTKSSPSPPLWTQVQLEGGRESRSSRSSASNSELSSVRDRTTSRSPPSLDDVKSGGSLLSSSSSNL